MSAVQPVLKRFSRFPVHGLHALASPEELRLAGRLSGLLYIAGALTAPALLLPGPAAPPAWVLWAEVGLGATWGIACLRLVPWERAPTWLTYLSSAGGLGMAAALAAVSGGVSSPAQMYLLFIVIFAASFYPRWEAMSLILAAAAARALPLLYQAQAVQHGLWRSVVIGLGTYLVAGGAILGGRMVVNGLRERADHLSQQRERLLAQHASLRRVATAVATSSPPRAVFTLVASEALHLLGADAAAVLRFDGEFAELAGTCGPQNPFPAGARFPLEPGNVLTQMRSAGQPVRIDGYTTSSRHREALGYRACVAAPVWVEQELWGGLCALARHPEGLAADVSERLQEFAHLVATSIANTERQNELLRRASCDELTGLPNHHSFHERLGSEVARAERHERALSLALVNIDGFKCVNDRLGHDAGNQLLVELTDTLRSSMRKGDVLARLGADEFGLLLPETDKRTAFIVLDRARQAVARKPLAHFGPVSFSAGICDLETAGGEGSLYRLADATLRWGKGHGPDVVWIYTPDIVTSSVRLDMAEDAERSAALGGLQALSRAIDAKDPLTRAHSERVATLVAQLAQAAGWSPQRIALLESAALVHDVGKIGVPDAILLKPGRLDQDEYEVIRDHASLGAQILEGVLSAEQVEWVRSHHERPDGRGYPNRLMAASISEGAGLLALADAFDAMTGSRVYGEPKDIDEAVAECRELEGRQFAHSAVRALERVYASSVAAAA